MYSTLTTRRAGNGGTSKTTHSSSKIVFWITVQSMKTKRGGKLGILPKNGPLHWRAQLWGGRMDDIDNAASPGNSEGERDHFCRQRWLHWQRGGALGAAWPELSEGRRKEWWGFKIARDLVLRLRRYLEKSPKREYDTEKGNDSGYCPVSGVLLLDISAWLFFFRWIQNDPKEPRTWPKRWLSFSRLCPFPDLLSHLFLKFRTLQWSRVNRDGRPTIWSTATSAKTRIQGDNDRI